MGKELKIIHEIKEEIKKLPNVDLESGDNKAPSFLQKLIELGSRLDQIFSIGDTENPSSETQEAIIEIYILWKLRIVSTLLKSSFSEKNKLRIKYPVLTENDGVRDILLPFTNSELGALTLNRKIRFGYSTEGSKIIRPGEEEIKQFNQAQNSLKKKLDALSKIYKEITEKKDVKEIIQLILDNNGLKRFRDEIELVYPIEKDSDRYVVLKKAINGPTRPKDIKIQGSKKVAAIKMALNKTIKTKLRLRDFKNHENLIVNRGAGYSINEKYLIEEVS